MGAVRGRHRISLCRGGSYMAQVFWNRRAVVRGDKKVPAKGLQPPANFIIQAEIYNGEHKPVPFFNPLSLCPFYLTVV